MRDAEFRMETIVGGDGVFCTVRHIVAKGTDRFIGERLAEVAASEHGVRPVPCDDPILLGARRRWFEVFYPQILERSHGVARHFGLAPDDSGHDLASLPLGVTYPGCSVGWLPTS